MGCYPPVIPPNWDHLYSYSRARGINSIQEGTGRWAGGGGGRGVGRNKDSII